MTKKKPAFEYVVFSVAGLRDGRQYNGEGPTPDAALRQATERADAYDAAQAEAARAAEEAALAAQAAETAALTPEEVNPDADPAHDATR